MTIKTIDEFMLLIASDDPIERRRAAWEDAPDVVWLSLIRDHPDLHFWIANNRTVPVDVMRMLIADGDWRVRDRIAMKNSCSTDILNVLSFDAHEAVASTVAGHPHTSDEALERLTRHPWSQVRDKALRQLAERAASADVASPASAREPDSTQP